MLSLGIDSGTQSTKSIIVDVESGRIVATAQRTYGFLEGLPPGHFEQDPRTWINAADDTVRECLAQLGEQKNDLVCIGVSGQQHGLVALNREHGVVRPAKLWCDTSTLEQCRQFNEEFGGPAGLIGLAGNPILPGYTAPKILWLKQNEPANFRASNCILLPHDYLNLWLTGEKQMEYGDASGTGLMDVRARKWCKPLCDFIDKGLLASLPALETSRGVAGLLREKLREQWGLSKSPLVSAGGGDNMMGAIGTGNHSPGVLTASLGTSGTLYSFSESPVTDPSGEIAAFCDSTDAWLPLVCTMNVTVATEAMRTMFGWEHEQLEREFSAVPPGADGLMFLPYLTGERTPNLPAGCGVLHGMKPGNMTPGHLARAAVEGTTLGLAYGLHRFRELGVNPGEIRLTGGGSRSAKWRQICADVFDVPVVCLTPPEGAALGAAIQAWWAHEHANGRSASLRSITQRLVRLDEDTRCEPNAKSARIYRDMLGRQTELTRRLHAAGYL